MNDDMPELRNHILLLKITSWKMFMSIVKENKKTTKKVVKQCDPIFGNTGRKHSKIIIVVIFLVVRLYVNFIFLFLLLCIIYISIISTC